MRKPSNDAARPRPDFDRVKRPTQTADRPAPQTRDKGGRR